jgi:hypothetical protein
MDLFSLLVLLVLTDGFDFEVLKGLLMFLSVYC